MKIYKNMTELIGKTPLLELMNIAKKYQLKSRILAKLEYFNPAGSVKDRIALEMIETAERKGILKPDSVIIEPTSGNTGIGIAAIAAAKGYKAIIIMPETMSIERRKLITAYGAELILTGSSLGMKGSIAKAEELAMTIPNSFIPGQFTNRVNSQAHSKTTGPEIWKDTKGQVDILVVGVGTGGTISGAGAYLKEKNPDIIIIAVEPAKSAVLSGETPGRHSIEGIGAGFIPDVLNKKIYDRVIAVKDEDAIAKAKEIAALEGVLVGISSGAALWAALSIAQEPENEGKNIVVILPDTGERYLTTALFEEKE